MRRAFVAAALALAAASTAACGGTHTSSPATVTVTTTPAQSVAPVAPVTPVMPPTEMNQWVNAGQLDFKVVGVAPGGIWADDDRVPPGQIIHVDIYVSNTSGVPQTYRADAQMLMDDQGRLFAPTPATTTNKQSRMDLNPGITSGMLFLDFAVPQADVDRYTLIVHGSHTSIGSPIHLHGAAS